MTGFQFGRKLGDWGKEDDPSEKEQVCPIPEPYLNPKPYAHLCPCFCACQVAAHEQSGACMLGVEHEVKPDW